MVRLLLLLPVGLSLALAADGLPDLDIENSCRAGMAAGLSLPRDPEHCIRDENNAHAELVKNWSTYPAADRSRCMLGPQAGRNSPSYVEILTCLQMERDVRSLNAKTRARE